MIFWFTVYDFRISIHRTCHVKFRVDDNLKNKVISNRVGLAQIWPIFESEIYKLDFWILGKTLREFMVQYVYGCLLFSDLKGSFRGQWGHLTTKSVSCQNFIQNNARNMKIKFLDLQENKFGEKSQFYVKISTNIITLWSYGALTNLLR